MFNQLLKAMRTLAVLSLPLWCLFLLQGCFKDEPLSQECDIEQVYFSVSDPKSIFYRDKDTLAVISSIEDKVVFHVQPIADITALAPRFVLSAGSTIQPAEGVPQDFSQGPVSYTVTSEDGAYQRTYSISLLVESSVGGEVTFFDFENPYEFRMNDIIEASFYSWTDISPKGDSLYNWSSANGGYAFTNSNAGLDDFPTVVLEDGYEGKGVKLTTLSTGMLGAMFGKPIAAGNLFIGSFSVETALQDALSATKFGKPSSLEPVAFKGYFKYKPGEVFTDKDQKVIDGRVDSGAIYAVIYRNEDEDGNEVLLNGNDVLSNPNLVATAVVDDVTARDEWTLFQVDFTYLKSLDKELLASKGYSLALVFSSSKDGDLFEGAVGSTLCIDSVCLVCGDYDNENDED